MSMTGAGSRRRSRPTVREGAGNHIATPRSLPLALAMAISLGLACTGDSPTNPVPTLLPTGVRFTTVSAGTAHSCAVTAEGRAYCWGGNQTGQLGIGTFDRQTTPTLVAPP